MSLWPRDLVELRIGDAPVSSTERRTAVQRLDALQLEFERALDACHVGRGARLRCVVGGDAVRYAVVPWNDELSSPQQRQRLAEQCLRETYGDTALGWTVSQHSDRHGTATLACAIDKTLIDRLDAVAQARGLTLASIQPVLMHAFNQVRRRIAPEPFWFVLIEPQGTTLLLMSPAEPLHVKRLPAAGAALAGALDREWFALGIEGERCSVYVLHTTGREPMPQNANLSGWRFIELSSPTPRAASRAEALHAA